MSISIKSVSSFIVILYSIVATVIWQVGDASYFSNATYCWLMLSFVVLLFGLNFVNDRLFPIPVLLSIFCLIWLYPRFFQIGLAPTTTSLLQQFGLSSADISLALKYMILGILSFLGGVTLVDKLSLHKKVIITAVFNGNSSERFIFFVIFVFYCLIQLYLQWGLQANVLISSNRVTSEHWVVAVLAILVNVNMAFMVLLVILLREDKKWGLFISAIIIYILYGTLLGSRSSGLSVVYLTIAVLLTLRANFSFSAKQYLAFLVILGLISFSAFPVATKVRNQMISQRVSADEGNLSGLTKKGGLLEGLLKKGGGISIVVPLLRLAPTLDRLGANDDSVIMILSQPGNQQLIEQYMTVEYGLKSAVNILVPGVIFPEAQVNSSFLPRFIYESIEIEQLTRDYYESRPWTIWGLTYILFGWYWGLFAIFICGVALSCAWVFLKNNTSQFNIIISTWFLLQVIGTLFENMGLDAYICQLFHTALGLILLLIVGKFLQSVFMMNLFKKVMPRIQVKIKLPS